MTPADALRATRLFAGLPEDQLSSLVEMCEPIELHGGERLIEEGTDGDAFFVIVDGELEVTKRSGEGELPLARLGPGGIVGEMAVIEGRPRNASVTAATDARVLRVPSRALLTVLARPDSALAILRTVMQRLRSTEAQLREREKLAGLGTLAAGLAHELNNPAAAAARSASAMEGALDAARAQPRPSQASVPPDGAAPPRSALERSDRIEAIAPLVGDDHEAAGALVEAGWTADSLGERAAGEVAWLAADASVRQLLSELSMAVGRISEIVAAVKGFSYLDQAPIQRVDLGVQLEQTLVIPRHRLREISIERDVADDLPEIEAHGSELNQVWTNLVDNAIDAMDGRGTLTLRANRLDDEVRVAICDTGSGISDAMRARLFEPFATSKPPGKGTGLGLHISHTVVARHGGRIEVESSAGGTCFEVVLPIR